MGPESQDQGIQRELVSLQIKDPISRELVKSSIPVELKKYQLTDREGQVFGQNLVELLRREGGNGYKYIFAMASVAQNPDQLANAYGALSILQHHAIVFDRRDSTRPDVKLIDQAQDQFLRAATTTPFASDGARALQAGIIGIWNQSKGDERSFLNMVCHTYEVDNTSGSVLKKEAAKFWAEAYLLAILDPKTPFPVRKALLANALRFRYGEGFFSREDPRFDKDASFWKQVNAEWLYPDLFGKGSQTDVKDWEIAGLRRTVADLQRQSEQRPQTLGVEQERVQLREMIARLQKVMAENEKKLQLYKTLGQHPLDALGIGYTVWKGANPEERRRLVLNAYRDRAKKYHYQIPESDPRFNLLTQELCNEKFGKSTKAYDYLNTHLDQTEF